jgi:glycosyltransferase involved in cell wall biosynthesis
MLNVSDPASVAPRSCQAPDCSRPGPWRIGYVLQTGVPDMRAVSGPQLHITAVVKALQRRQHRVRTLMAQTEGIVCSDNLDRGDWENVPFGFSAGKPFRLVERPLRRIQSELRLPYLNLFESIRFSDAAARALAGSTLLFERFGFMGYGGVLTAARLGIPLILEVNGDIPKEMELLNVGLTPAQRRISAIVTRRTLAAADRIVCVAPRLKQTLVESIGLPPDKVEVIQNGADVELFVRPQNPAAVREEFRLAPRPTVTFVGSFQPWHGVDLLLDAFRAVARESGARLLLVGDGAGRAAADAQSAASDLAGRVRFMGALPNTDVAKILAVSDVAVVPFPDLGNRIVGSPLKIFEYMAAGCAIVASRAAIHDVIEHGQTGLRVAPGDPADLAAAILQLLRDEDLRRRLGACAREVAVKRFSWDHTVAQLEALFARALDAHNSKPRPS